MRPAHEHNTVENDLTSHGQPPPSLVAFDGVHHDGKPKEKFWRKIVNWMTDMNNDTWLEEIRGMLSLVSTMIASITFQSSMNPPGGLLQANDGITYDQLMACKDDKSRPCAGEAIIANLYPDLYNKFETYNTICFIASFSVTLFLVSGVPLNHKIPIWMLSIGMMVTLTFLALTYLYAIKLIYPVDVDDDSWNGYLKIVGRSIYTWVALVGIIALFLTVRFLVWFLKKCIQVYSSPASQQLSGIIKRKISARPICI